MEAGDAPPLSIPRRSFSRAECSIYRNAFEVAVRLLTKPFGLNLRVARTLRTWRTCFGSVLVTIGYDLATLSDIASCATAAYDNRAPPLSARMGTLLSPYFSDQDWIFEKYRPFAAPIRYR